ncbi:MAG: esterase YqiA [Gammaproteobacteria bacterium]|nr:esterase YqiA [Gammaproteobacteria bacterium]
MLFLYIHGFNSSPQSFKARCFAHYLKKNHPQDEFMAPELSDLPKKAIDSLCQCIQQHRNAEGKAGEEVALIGSSLGGFYATWLAQKYNLKAVLVNPAVNPYELLVDYLGENINYHTEEKYTFTLDHIEQLKALMTSSIDVPENLLVLLQSGDEVLDYRLAQKKHSSSNLIIESGGDHSFNHFERYCDNIYGFLNPEHQK